MGLDRVRAVAQTLGIAFECPVITVGGTNGKGSTCAMLESILLAAGFKVALHTSPHLLEFNERARFLGESAADEALVMHLAAVEQVRGDIQLTYFEFTLLAILRWFQSCQPDVVILEVGLGGRFDAVNAFDADCAVITSIDLDHMEFLGPDRESIGREKAGIIFVKTARGPVPWCATFPRLMCVRHAVLRASWRRKASSFSTARSPVVPRLRRQPV